MCVLDMKKNQDDRMSCNVQCPICQPGKNINKGSG